MKKLFTLSLSALLSIALFSQTYYSENFNSGIPANFVLWNLDGNTPASASWTSDAWMARPTSATATDKWAGSTSDFNPVGVANRWMVTPQIIIPSGATGVLLTWDAYSYSGNYPESYEVKLSTTDSLTTSFTTLLFSTPGENPDWTIHAIDLNAYAGDTIRLAFRNKSNNKYAMGLDNIKVFSAPAYDVALKRLDIYEHNTFGNPINLDGEVRSYASLPMDSYKISYSVNGAAAVTTNISGTPTVYDEVNNFSVTYNPPAEGIYKVKVWVSLPNGNPDLTPADDTLNFTFFSYTPRAKKKVLAEEFTGAWCQYCPGGHASMEELLSVRNDVVPICIQDDGGYGAQYDKLMIPEGDAVAVKLADGFPSIMFDRQFFYDRQTVNFSPFVSWFNQDVDWNVPSDQRLNWAVPANVSLLNLEYDTAARQLEVDVKADFFNAVSGDLRLNLMLTEDSVIGNGLGYDQANSFSGDANFSTSPFYSEADPIANYPHRHVLRKSLDGAWGTAGYVTTPTTNGGSATRHYSFSVPAAWNASRMNVIGVLQEYNTDARFLTVLNVEEAKLIRAVNTGINESHSELFKNIQLYPNPAQNEVKLEIELKENAVVKVDILNILGSVTNETYEADLNVGIHTINLNTKNLAQGTYLVKIEAAGIITTKRLVINK